MVPPNLTMLGVVVFIVPCPVSEEWGQSSHCKQREMRRREQTNTLDKGGGIYCKKTGMLAENRPSF